MKTNNKGFTLIELLATIVLIAIVAGFGTYSITNVIKSSKEKNYQLLIKNIKSAAEVYYQECRYDDKATSNGAICEFFNNGEYAGYWIPLIELVNQGYLTGNAKEKNTGNYIVVDTKTNKNIGNCNIGVGYKINDENDKNDKNDKLYVLPEPNSPSYCPKDYGG